MTNYRVGHAAGPKPNDPTFPTLASAEAAAEVLAERDDKDAIAIWDGNDEIVLLLYLGDEFVRRGP